MAHVGNRRFVVSLVRHSSLYFPTQAALPQQMRVGVGWRMLS